MADYRVNLDVFAGPLDLLLYLVRKEEVDIYDIPIATITDQYLRYIEILKQLDVDVAGDFLVMAATLMEIKSAMLLPKAQPEDMTEDEAIDPRAELIRQLLEYKKFKDAANMLHAAAEQRKERFSRPTSLIDQLTPDAEPELDMDQVSIWDLLEAFDAICKATGRNIYTGHIQDDTPIDLYQIELLHRLQTEGPLTFERVFESRPNRLVMVGLFLAMLELIRDKLVWAEQAEGSSQIYVRALTDEPAEQAVQRAIIAVDDAETEEKETEAQVAADEEGTEAAAEEEPPAPAEQKTDTEVLAAGEQTETLASGAETETFADETETEPPAEEEAEGQILAEAEEAETSAAEGQTEEIADEEEAESPAGETEPEATTEGAESKPAVEKPKPPHKLPIPIAELPPKRAPHSSSREDDRNRHAASADDDFAFDKP